MKRISWPGGLKRGRKSDDPEEPPTDPQFPEPQPTPPDVKPKSGAVTILLAVLLCGAGHVYAGQVRRGLILLGISVAIVAAVSVMGGVVAPAVFDADGSTATVGSFLATTLAPIVGGLAFYAWTIYDAWKVHSRYNAVLAKTGVPPW